jgi:integration host factor subunit beta
MNKTDLIHALYTKENLSIKNASDVINLVFDGFTDALKKGKRSEIRGFGIFTVREHHSYTGRNPKTGEKIPVKPKKFPFFKVGKKLQDRVNQDALLP